MRPAGQRWLWLDLPVWVAFVMMLGFGMLILRQDDARAHPWNDQQGGLQLRYPVGWLPTPGSKALLEVQDPFSGGPLPARVIVTRTSTAANRSLAEIVNEVVLAHSQDRTLYRVLSLEAARIGDSEARAIEYAYVADPHEAVLTAQRLPVVLRGVEVVAVQGTRLYSIDFSAPSETFAGQRRVFDRILRESKL